MLKKFAGILNLAVRILTLSSDNSKKKPKTWGGVCGRESASVRAQQCRPPHPRRTPASSPPFSAPAEPRANAPGWRHLGAGGDDAKPSAPPQKSVSPGRRWRQLSRGLKMTVALRRPSPGDSAPRSGGGGVSSRSPAAAAPAGRPAAAAAAAAVGARGGGWGGGRALPAAAAQAPDSRRESEK